LRVRPPAAARVREPRRRAARRAAARLRRQRGRARSARGVARGGRAMSAWPKHLTLELTNACDLRCKHCHFHGDGGAKLRQQRMMGEPMWRAAVEEIQAWRTPITLQPWGMGESLLHPQLWEVVELAKRSPDVQVGLYSNGMQWDDAAIERALDLE